MSPACTVRVRNGFSLVELAIAIALIGLLLGGILVPLQARVEQRQVADTQKTLENTQDALIGFAAAKGYLPCPDTGTNGSENVTGSQCTTIASGMACGRLPHADLGLTNSDVWGNRFTYCVNELFARRGAGSTFTLSTAGNDISICTTQSCATTISTTAVLAVVSHGQNGYGATKLATGAVNSCPTPPVHPGGCSADEQENFDTDGIIVSRTRTAAGATAGEFDDIVIWLPRFTLFNRMVAAGKLP